MAVPTRSDVLGEPSAGAPAALSPLLAVLGRGIVDPDVAVVRADDAGITRGDGCFEGCRLHRGRVDKPDLHFARMARSAAALAISFDEPAWRQLLEQAVAAWSASAAQRSGPGADEAAVKLVLTRGSPGTDALTGYVWITPLAADYPRQRRDGLRVITLGRGTTFDAFAAAPWLLGGVKTLSYAINMAAAREAARRGADDVIFLSADGRVLEAPTASVVWSVGRTLHTVPTGGSGVLAGTTQRLLFDRARDAGWQLSYSAATLDDLHAADVVWLTSSVRGPVDVVDLDGTARPRKPEVDAEIRRLAGFVVE